MQEITERENQATSIDKLIWLARKHLNLEKLTPTVLHDPVNAIYVHAPDQSSGHRVRDITISCNRIGILPAHSLSVLKAGKQPASLYCQAIPEKASILSY